MVHFKPFSELQATSDVKQDNIISLQKKGSCSFPETEKATREILDILWWSNISGPLAVKTTLGCYVALSVCYPPTDCLPLKQYWMGQALA